MWVPVHDEGGDGPVSIWIDRALTAFEAQMQAEHVEIAVTGLMQERVGRGNGICKDV